MLKTKSAGGIVKNRDGMIALVKNGEGEWWGFPKGHVDEGEGDLEAALREIEEETGLKSMVFVRDLGVYERFRGGPDGGENKSEWKEIHMYLFVTDEVALAPTDPANPEARWFRPDEVASKLSIPRDREFYEHVRGNL